MKLFMGLLLVIFSCFALIGAERSASCLQKHSKNGDGLRACLGFMPSWSYNSEENKCVEFVYGGCGGNDNRFGSQLECEKACKI